MQDAALLRIVPCVENGPLAENETQAGSNSESFLAPAVGLWEPRLNGVRELIDLSSIALW